MNAAFDGSVVAKPYAGVQLSVLAEIRALAQQLQNPSQSVFFCRDQELRAQLGSRGARLGQLPPATRRVWVRILWQQLVLPGTLRRLNADVLHALAYTAPLRCPIPYVLNVHDIIALERPELCAPLNRVHMRALLPGSIRRASALIVSTEHVAERVHARLGVPREKITVAPLGVDVERFSSPLPRPTVLPVPENRPYVLFVGNLEPKKDVDTLLDAYEACASAQEFDLVLVGRAAWLCADLVQRIRGWRGPGRIHWLGRVDGEHLPALMQHAAALVMPSIEEGFGMPVLEAMAAATPVIHSDHPALKEAAGGAGLSFPRRDPAELAVRIDRLLHDQALSEELQEAGREHAARRTWAKWGEAAVEVLERVTSAT